MGVDVPQRRSSPVNPLLGGPPLICEVKRRSPSRGAIDETLDPVALVASYVQHGARSVSVLTEEDHFHGSLRDLIEIKAAFPHVAALRKDFLLSVDDVVVSHRAGADAVLLIASVLARDELADMLRAAQDLGMTALVELHDVADVDKTRPLSPPTIGINSRNLADFTVDLLTPLRLRRHIDWEHSCLFESGLFTQGHAHFVSSSGFSGALVGEGVVRDPSAIPGLIRGLTGQVRSVKYQHPSGDFWKRLVERSHGVRPLVKVCGITNRADAEHAVDHGADMLGFVFADSPRRTYPELVRELRNLPVLKAGVVVSGGKHGPLPSEIGRLLSEGVLDVIQFHGDEDPAMCAATAFPYYRAVRAGSPSDLEQLGDYDCPRILIDARSETAYGGTGKRVSADVVRSAQQTGAVWLAGGLDPDNIAPLVSEFHPELVDVSSGLEHAPGKKDPEKVKRFFQEINRV